MEMFVCSWCGATLECAMRSSKSLSVCKVCAEEGIEGGFPSAGRGDKYCG